MLERIEDGQQFSRVLPVLKGKLVAAIGGGPSLTMAQVFAVQEAGKRCVAINDAYLWAPFADMLYAADQHWWDDHHKGIAKPALGLTAEQVAQRFKAYPGQRCTIQPPDNKPVIHRQHVLKNRDHPCHGMGLSTDPEALVTGRNSGWQVINLLALAQAKVIVLLGFDGRPSATGRSHWSGGHRKPTQSQAYEEYRKACSAGENALKAAGVRVVNASPDSGIDSFEKMTIGEALCL
jgi:hypothetical protein